MSNLRHPVNVMITESRSLQQRMADAIARFAGSMVFVYIHMLWFGYWILGGVERYPFGLLTLIVSLEAIFLSTFVMISQNRQADFAQKRAEHDFKEQDQMLKVNTKLTLEIHALTKQIAKEQQSQQQRPSI